MNPLKLLEKEYTLLILQYLHLNPTGRTFELICSSIEHHAPPSKVNARLNDLLDLGLVIKVRGEDDQVLFALSHRGRCASEVVWDLFRIILNPREEQDDGKDFLDFLR